MTGPAVGVLLYSMGKAVALLALLGMACCGGMEVNAPGEALEPPDAMAERDAPNEALTNPLREECDPRSSSYRCLAGQPVEAPGVDTQYAHVYLWCVGVHTEPDDMYGRCTIYCLTPSEVDTCTWLGGSCEEVAPAAGGSIAMCVLH